jgi:hypothetical protein
MPTNQAKYASQHTLSQNIGKAASCSLLISLREGEFGTPPILVIQAHQEESQETLTRSSGDFLLLVHSSARSESPKVMEFHKTPITS